ncbi:MAG: transcriptional regulator [Aquabacterium sp.]|nr:MAG: transcriptional regulator [Aquabacterium sp.]TAL15010.1 MAG: transcriptional regulator [Aquabacterium sp.]
MDYPLHAATQLAAHLRALRKAKGWNQAQLGQVLGVGQTRIARIEADPTAISVDQLFRLLGALGVRLVLQTNDPPEVRERAAQGW